MRCLFLVLVPALLFGHNPILKTRLSNLDPLSVAEHFAFYELYPETEEGKQALTRAWHLLSDGKIHPKAMASLPPADILPLISLITREKSDRQVILEMDQLNAIEELCKELPNRFLKGHQIWTRKQLLDLEPHEIDLSRGLLIEQFNENLESIRQYEAGLDLMALQIRARLPQTATYEDQIREINRFVFQEMKFRFPPHSLHAKDIDLYTFLPSVMDSREGVCLGVSIIYLCLAQRLGLPLEIITPPGHIYVRYRNGVKIINIETTARGVNLPSDVYLGLDTRRLQERNLKEVIGMAYFNQASVAWGQNDFVKTLELYEKARPYLGKDPLLDLLMGLNFLFVGKKKEGRALLQKLDNYTFDWAVSPETLASDYLKGKVDADGIKTVFMHVDETRDSILKKQQILLKTIKKYPSFRGGLLQLAVTYLQLGRYFDAESVLEKYHLIDPHNSVVEYYLAAIATERFDYNKAWRYLRQTEAILEAREHKSPALRGLRNFLRHHVCEIGG